MNCLQRINWIDWSKVFAIYLVVLGHLVQRTGYLFNSNVDFIKTMAK